MGRKKQYNKYIKILLTSWMHDELKVRAEREDKTVSQVVRDILVAHVGSKQA